MRLVGVVVEFGVETCSVLSSPGSSWCLFPSQFDSPLPSPLRAA